MRKLNFRSFAYTTLGSLLFWVGLIVVENPNVAFGKSSPDVLMFLGGQSQSENPSAFDFEEEGEAYDFPSFEEETSLDVDSAFSEETNVKEQNVSSEVVDADVEFCFESDEFFSTELSAEETDVAETSSLSDDSIVASDYQSEELFENVEAVEKDATTSDELNSLIEQVKSVSADLNKTLQEDATRNDDEIELSDVDWNDDLFSDVQDSNDVSFVEENDVPTTEDYVNVSIEESQESESIDEEKTSEEENVPVIIVEQVDVVALPEIIEESLEETSALNADNIIDSSNDVASNESSTTSNESTFKNAEKFLTEEISEELLNPNALEIEEINEEYGWKTVESAADSTATNPFVDFDSNARLSKSESRRFNKPYNEEATEIPSNEFWIVGDNGYDYYFWKYENNSWRRLSSDEFFSTDDPRRTTIIWAHGYQTDMSTATQSGTFLNSLIEKGRRNTNQNKPYRLVVWKWNSERNMARIRIDAKNKTALANCSGVSLGKFIGRFNSSDNISLIGFSFGAQVVGSALQYLATHTNDYLQRIENSTSGVSKSASAGKVSLMLISAACDSRAFYRGGAYGYGATIPSKVLNVFNPYDFALRYYPFVSDVHSDSFGVHAVSNDVFPNTEGRISNFDVSGSVGREHSFVDEIGSIPSETLVDFFFNE